MKAAFYDGNGAMIVKDYPDLTPGPGEALIKVRSTGICGSDLNMNLDKSSPDSDPAGHEVAGTLRLLRRRLRETGGSGRAGWRSRLR